MARKPASTRTSQLATGQTLLAQLVSSLDTIGLEKPGQTGCAVLVGTTTHGLSSLGHVFPLLEPRAEKHKSSRDPQGPIILTPEWILIRVSSGFVKPSPLTPGWIRGRLDDGRWTPCNVCLLACLLACLFVCLCLHRCPKGSKTQADYTVCALAASFLSK